jgi:two-component system response regulator RegA
LKTSEQNKDPKNGHAAHAAHIAHAAHAAHAAARSVPRRFLVVDDDAAFRTRLVKALAARGIEARGAASGEEALAAAPTFAPNAAIVDLRMHGMSGLDLVRALTAQQPGIQVLVLTGYGSIATAVEAVRRGAMNYLNKPVDTEQILAAFGREGESGGAAAPSSEPAPVEIPSLARVEWEHIQRVLFDCEGNISLAARRLGLHRRSLQRKLAKLPPLE